MNFQIFFKWVEFSSFTPNVFAYKAGLNVSFHVFECIELRGDNPGKRGETGGTCPKETFSD